MRDEKQPFEANTAGNVMTVRVNDVGTQFERTVVAGVRVLESSTDHVYGERE
ncbi:doubtful CDS [Mycobacterium leprae Kyoto-2]|uniref:Doubtful CDS n=3 Tax=Mycobacterium leprae TaxID=1769 RepID=Q7AQ91_MYCLE|nr:hypothetical protein [Mycobacterium leprae]CAR71243.1 doubtful CDS [Mycobacterium leprae Br4923]AAA63088.1 u471c [Mycobacterium leprae]AWV47809.1 hypothetical protein DIJ64_06170 [Mycobacterium leprae]OAR19657.1 hypothetical protein A8144_04300 [Mycobacterium leprae 3125609]OAX71834.1 hypothetical protein A3216_03370 [Mycobacterium leprae 7935681]